MRIYHTHKVCVHTHHKWAVSKRCSSAVCNCVVRLTLCSKWIEPRTNASLTCTDTQITLKRWVSENPSLLNSDIIRVDLKKSQNYKYWALKMRRFYVQNRCFSDKNLLYKKKIRLAKCFCRKCKYTFTNRILQMLKLISSKSKTLIFQFFIWSKPSQVIYFSPFLFEL